MLRSLVGSEMCIRDSYRRGQRCLSLTDDASFVCSSLLSVRPRCLFLALLRSLHGSLRLQPVEKLVTMYMLFLWRAGASCGYAQSPTFSATASVSAGKRCLFVQWCFYFLFFHDFLQPLHSTFPSRPVARGVARPVETFVALFLSSCFFFSSRRRHTRCSGVSWARRCV